jgi:NitT/TauT family transport system substrate-binding protein
MDEHVLAAAVRRDETTVKQRASPEEIAKLMPEEYARAIMISMWLSSPIQSQSHVLTREGAQNALKVLSAFDPAVAGAKIDLDATYTNRLVEKASALH